MLLALLDDMHRKLVQLRNAHRHWGIANTEEAFMELEVAVLVASEAVARVRAEKDLEAA